MQVAICSGQDGRIPILFAGLQLSPSSRFEFIELAREREHCKPVGGWIVFRLRKNRYAQGSALCSIPMQSIHILLGNRTHRRRGSVFWQKLHVAAATATTTGML